MSQCVVVLVAVGRLHPLVHLDSGGINVSSPRGFGGPAIEGARSPLSKLPVWPPLI